MVASIVPLFFLFEVSNQVLNLKISFKGKENIHCLNLFNLYIGPSNSLTVLHVMIIYPLWHLNTPDYAFKLFPHKYIQWWQTQVFQAAPVDDDEDGPVARLAELKVTTKTKTKTKIGRAQSINCQDSSTDKLLTSDALFQIFR